MSGLPLPLKLADSPTKGFGIGSFHPVGKIAKPAWLTVHTGRPSEATPLTRLALPRRQVRR